MGFSCVTSVTTVEIPGKNISTIVIFKLDLSKYRRVEDVCEELPGVNVEDSLYYNGDSSSYHEEEESDCRTASSLLEN